MKCAIPGPNRHLVCTAWTGPDLRIVSCVDLRIAWHIGTLSTRIRIRSGSSVTGFGSRKRIRIAATCNQTHELTNTHLYTQIYTRTGIHQYTRTCTTNTHLYTYTLLPVHTHMHSLTHISTQHTNTHIQPKIHTQYWKCTPHNTYIPTSLFTQREK